MSANYSKGKPLGKNTVPQYDSPPNYPALVSGGSTNQAASSVITLSQDTTAIEVATAGAGGAYLKWIKTTDTTASVYGVTSVGATFPANYDHFIPAATERRFVVPVDPSLQSPSQPFTYGSPSTVAFASMVGANVENSLYRRVAIMAAGGTASVLTSEY